MAQNINKLEIDFLSGAINYRLKYGGGKRQALPKAIGMKNYKSVRIIDATAGLGRDAFLLASLGANVTLIERSKKIYCLLNAAIKRAKDGSEEVQEIIARMTLIHGDAKVLLPSLNPQIILIDPMHPERKKSALVKQQMRQLRKIVGADEDAAELINIALNCASKRVVLKWPQNSPLPKINKDPTHQIKGKTTRYDVFMI